MSPRRRAGSDPNRFLDSEVFVPAQLAAHQGAGDAERQAAWLNDLTSLTRAMPKHHPHRQAHASLGAPIGAGDVRPSIDLSTEGIQRCAWGF